MAKPRLVISSGDPAGVGPEVTVKALAQPEVAARADAVVTGDARLIERVAAQLGLPVPRIEPAGDAGGVQPGRLSAEAGRAAVAAVERGLELVQGGEVDAL